jgi:O-antigen biosynthesis protein
LVAYARWKIAGSPLSADSADAVNQWLQAYREILPEVRCPEVSMTIVTPVFNTPGEMLIECVESVTSQTHGNWNLILVDDASDSPDTRAALEQVAELDARIRVFRLEVNVGISGATNAGLAQADGDFVLFLDHDDLLASTALDWVASVADEADLVYSDEDKIDDEGHHYSPIFKPSWSPRLLLGINYVNHLTAVRRTLLNEVGGLREGYDGVQDHDLVLRLAELDGLRVAHLPNVLYHWRMWDQATSHGADASARRRAIERRGLEMIQETLDRRDIHATARLGNGLPFNYRPVFELPETPVTVKIVIPTRDRRDLLEEAITGLLERTDGVAVSLVVVDNGSRDPSTIEYLDGLRVGQVAQIVRIDDAFNFSMLCNRGVRTGPPADHLLFLNNDVSILHRGWLQQLVGWLESGPEVVGVGAKLVSREGRIRHAGVVVGLGGIAGHYGAGLADEPELGNLHDQAREVGALTAACLLVRSRDFDAVGGFDEAFPSDFGDVDLCLRLRRDLGGVLVYDPTFPLLHHESASREVRPSGYIQTRFRHLWDEELRRGDPYYSPHLRQYTRLDPVQGRIVHEPCQLEAIPDGMTDKLCRLRPRSST